MHKKIVKNFWNVHHLDHKEILNQTGGGNISKKFHNFLA